MMTTPRRTQKVDAVQTRSSAPTDWRMKMKTLRMARNIAALGIVAMALVASPPGRAAQAEGKGNGSCDQAITPCCCDKSGHTQLPKTDPNHDACESVCLWH